jgi:hypothetical protein
MDPQDIQAKSNTLISAIAAEKEAMDKVHSLQNALVDAQSAADNATKTREAAQEVLNEAINPPSPSPAPGPVPVPPPPTPATA